MNTVLNLFVVSAVPVIRTGTTDGKVIFVVHLSAIIFPRARGLTSIYPSFPSYLSFGIKAGVLAVSLI